MSSTPARDFPLRRPFLLGLAVGAPIVVTMWIVWTVIQMIDNAIVPMIPKSLLASDALLRTIPGAGVLVFFVAAVSLGLFARGMMGRGLVRLSDRIFVTLPVVRTIYSATKQVSDTFVNDEGAKFDRACLIEYPRPGSWSVGFVAKTTGGEIATRFDDTMLTVFVPTTPNPTSGFLLVVPEADAIPLEMSIESAVKLVISGGLIEPGRPEKNPGV